MGTTLSRRGCPHQLADRFAARRGRHQSSPGRPRPTTPRCIRGKTTTARVLSRTPAPCSETSRFGALRATPRPGRPSSSPVRPPSRCARRQEQLSERPTPCAGCRRTLTDNTDHDIAIAAPRVPVVDAPYGDLPLSDNARAVPTVICESNNGRNYPGARDRVGRQVWVPVVTRLWRPQLGPDHLPIFPGRCIIGK